ncbi:phospholipase [Salinadaptatus halalkaliphilus]|uniref:Phospholipase n=1 Tax=Salinadaptatus halalkaliphilus TaxID=2419781 RepID=A0A4S3TQJ3_9EURY|nr:dienelactone hydrolase family protein [Salinadaptatus halalkaliphilus]THE66669.1 phospholipase [Salinadaptatus halalkaliphilus]
MTATDRRLPDVSGPHGDQPLITAGAPARGADVAVVACHGRGATAQGVINLFDPVYRHGIAFLAPQAAGSSWYPRPASAPRGDNEPWLTSSVDAVGATLEAARAIAIPPERTLLAGFSQGASVVAEYCRRKPARYGGVCLLSGHLPGGSDDDRSIDGQLERTPVLVGYGDADAQLDSARVTETARAFEQAGAVVDERSYPDVGHEVTDDEFDAIRTMCMDLLED